MTQSQEVKISSGCKEATNRDKVLDAAKKVIGDCFDAIKDEMDKKESAQKRLDSIKEKINSAIQYYTLNRSTGETRTIIISELFALLNNEKTHSNSFSHGGMVSGGKPAEVSSAGEVVIDKYKADRMKELYTKRKCDTCPVIWVCKVNNPNSLFCKEVLEKIEVKK